MAGDGDPTDDKRALAKKHFDEGAALYTQGSYQEAILAWEKAYELSEEPLIFENMANAYERLGQLKKAREHLALWREAASAAERPLLDKRLANLDGRIAKRARAEALVPDDEKKKKKKKRKGSSRSSVSVPGIVLTSIGGAAVVAGVIVGTVGSSQRPDESEVCGSLDDRSLCQESAREDIDAGNTLAMVGDLVWIAGSITAAVGVVLIITYDPGGGPTEVGIPNTLRLAPRVAQGGGGLTLEGRF